MCRVASFLSPGLFLLLGSTLILLYIVLGAVRRLYFNPLARFPGPKLSALTFWVEFYHDVIRRGQYTFEIIKMHEKYGGLTKIEFNSCDRVKSSAGEHYLWI